MSTVIGNDKVSSCMTSGEPGSNKNKRNTPSLVIIALGPTDAKCEFDTLDVLTGSVVSSLKIPTRSYTWIELKNLFLTKFTLHC